MEYKYHNCKEHPSSTCLLQMLNIKFKRNQFSETPNLHKIFPIKNLNSLPTLSKLAYRRRAQRLTFLTIWKGIPAEI